MAIEPIETPIELQFFFHLTFEKKLFELLL